MTDINKLISENIDIWTSSIEIKSSSGRGSNNKYELYGIKKLRELILELAVRGKLVPQNPDDEPTTVLLEKITDEREKLVKEGKIRKQKPLPAISEEEKPFDLPDGWVFIRLQDIINISSGNGLTSSNMNSDGNIPVFGGNGITGYHDQYNVNKPTLVIGRVGFYCGSIHITPEKAWVTDNAFITTFSENHILISFLYWLLRGTNLKENDNATAQPVISGRKLYPLVVALPPLDEQKRIVIKVVELMELCDQLEKQTEESISAHKVLVETLLNTLSQSQDSEELTENWNRISEHFDILFTTEDSIDQLKQTILQLAVMGKLVPQDSNDESASVLLEKIATEKEQLIKEGKIKKQKPSSPITNDEVPFDLPDGWEWIRLQEITTLLGDGLHGTPEYTPNEKYYFVNGNNLENDRIIIKSNTKTVSFKEYEKYKKRLEQNTVLVSINGTLGNLAFYNNEKIVLGKSACYFNLTNHTNKYFIKLLIKSPFFINYAFTKATGSTIKNLSLQAMNSLPIALPPLNEQSKIVDQVNELMKVCDHLKNNLNKIKKTQINLTDSLITLSQSQ